MTSTETLIVAAAGLQTLALLAGLAGAGWIARREVRRTAFAEAAKDQMALARGRAVLALCLSHVERAHALFSGDGGLLPMHPDPNRWMHTGMQLIDRTLNEVPSEPRLIETLLGMRMVLQNGAAITGSLAATDDAARGRNRQLEHWARSARRLLEDYDAGRDYAEQMPVLIGMARPQGQPFT